MKRWLIKSERMDIRLEHVKIGNQNPVAEVNLTAPFLKYCIKPFFHLVWKNQHLQIVNREKSCLKEGLCLLDYEINRLEKRIY